MFGFLVGSFSLAGLIWVLRHRDLGRGRHPFRRERRLLNWVFGALDTSPGQERTIRSAVRDLEQDVREMRQELRGVPAELGDALKPDVFDEAALAATLDRTRATLDSVQAKVAATFRSVHETLDPEQRTRLAALLRQRRGFRHGGPYRCAP
jgi:uncharacterized membrane protein